MPRGGSAATPPSGQNLENVAELLAAAKRVLFDLYRFAQDSDQELSYWIGIRCREVS